MLCGNPTCIHIYDQESVWTLGCAEYRWVERAVSSQHTFDTGTLPLAQLSMNQPAPRELCANTSPGRCQRFSECVNTSAVSWPTIYRQLQ